MMRAKLISMAACFAALPLRVRVGDDYGPGYYAPPPRLPGYVPERDYREQPG